MCRVNTKTRLTMLCFSGMELYSRWVSSLILHLGFIDSTIIECGIRFAILSF